MFLLQLLIGHLLGDFYFQTEKMAKSKKNYLLSHALIYSVTIFILSLGFGKVWQSLIIFVVMFLSHFLIDLVKEKLLNKNYKYQVSIFFIDQILHLIIIIAISIWKLKSNYLGNAIFEYFRTLFDTEPIKVLAIIFALILIFKPSSIYIENFFSIRNDIFKSSYKKEDFQSDQKDSPSNDCNAPKTGKIIGYFERFLMLLLGLLGFYTTMGIVLTAKSLARFKQLEEKAFAEKFLLGTLASMSIVILCLVIIFNAYTFDRI